ncbi:MAG: EAL domain-containing protein [Armatimonadetes bacterium]|nr:EAL domain-containing protein [Armatimonadota bacterium]
MNVSSPSRLGITLTFLIFCSEVVVMCLLPILKIRSVWVTAIIDAIVLVVLFVPWVYVFVFRPLNLQIIERKRVEDALRLANAEIDKVNCQLETALLASKEYAVFLEIAKGEIEENAVELSHQATHDALTGLPNRHYFEQHLSKLIKSASGKKLRSLAVLFIDLDNFKMVNDTLGHKAGDALLVDTAARLSSCLREGDILARMDGDEFTILLDNINSKDAPAKVAQRILEQISMPYEIVGSRLVIGASIGVSICPDNATDVVGLLKFADAAMYKAKEMGRNNCQFFSDEISQANMTRIEMEQDLRLAIERDMLKVYYQPIVDIKTMQIAGAEALLRWDHPEKGMISPGMFIPVAEETGLILQMGKLVLETACKQCRSWHDMGYDDFEMSVNVSPIQLSDIGFVSEVDEALSQVGLPPGSLKIEVTETTLAKNENDELDVLGILKSLGVSICLDDFGVGFSSLSRLNKLPISHLKIDGYFIRNCDQNQNDRAMTESIIVMAHNLGMRVTAEWVEDQEQMATIRSLDCDYAQGYLISPALAADAFESFLKDWSASQQSRDAA